MRCPELVLNAPRVDNHLDLHWRCFYFFLCILSWLSDGQNLNGGSMIACGVKLFADFLKPAGRIRPASQLRHTNASTYLDISQLMCRNVLAMPHQRSSVQHEKIRWEDEYMTRLHMASTNFLANISALDLGCTNRPAYCYIEPVKQQL